MDDVVLDYTTTIQAGEWKEDVLFKLEALISGKRDVNSEICRPFCNERLRTEKSVDGKLYPVAFFCQMLF